MAQKGEKSTYDVKPSSGPKLTLARSFILEAQLFVKPDQMIMRHERDPVSNSGAFDSLLVGFHNDLCQTPVAKCRKHGEGVHCNCTAIFLMTARVQWSHSRLPLSRIIHRGISNGMRFTLGCDHMTKKNPFPDRCRGIGSTCGLIGWGGCLGIVGTGG